MFHYSEFCHIIIPPISRIKNKTKYSSSKIIRKITQKFPADFIFIPGHWTARKQGIFIGNFMSNAWVRKRTWQPILNLISIHPLEKIPTHEMIHRFSTPVQSKSNRTPQNPPKTHSKSNASPEKPSTRSSKNFNQNLPVSPKILQKKNWFLLDDSKADKNIPNCSLTQLANWSVVRRLDSSIF